MSETVDTTFEELAGKVRRWASDRQIIQNSTAEAQLNGKGKEELQEAIDAAVAGDHIAFVDGIGDTMVVLIIACSINGVDPVDALAHAYGEIKDRRGYLDTNGIFVKNHE